MNAAAVSAGHHTCATFNDEGLTVSHDGVAFIDLTVTNEDGDSMVTSIHHSDFPLLIADLTREYANLLVAKAHKEHT